MRLSGSGYNLSFNQSVGSSRSNRIGLPVSNKALIYSYFKHVQGYSAGDNASTVPISKIRILNNLIDNLSKIKHNDREYPSDAEVSPEAIDALIDQYSQDLHQSIAMMHTGFNGGETGLVVSLTA